MTTKRKHEDSSTSNQNIEKTFSKDTFNTVCEQESRKAFLDDFNRVKLYFKHLCTDVNNCQHNLKNNQGKQRGRKSEDIKYSQNMTLKAKSCFDMLMNGQAWYDALETCIACILSKQYLVVQVLNDIVEIMLNAQMNIFSKVSIKDLLNKCKLVLALHFRIHAPCVNNDGVKKIYTEFLTGPMLVKIPDDKSPFIQNEVYMNKKACQYEKGIVHYCFMRLEKEVFDITEDGPLIDKDCDKDRDSNKKLNKIQKMHYSKEEHEIYETLDRADRIDRLMSVLHSLIDLCQINLTYPLQHADRYLMSQLLWPEISEEDRDHFITKQVIKLFLHFIQYNYPEQHIKTMSLWLNTIIETVYRSDKYGFNNYPLIGRNGNGFSKLFVDSMLECSYEAITKVLQRIEPSYMKHSIGLKYIQWLFKRQKYINEGIISFITKFFEKQDQKYFKDAKYDRTISKKLNEPINMKTFSQICKNAANNYNSSTTYPKFQEDEQEDNTIRENVVTTPMYITLVAFLDAYNIGGICKSLSESENSTASKRAKQSETKTEQKSSYTIECLKSYKQLNQLYLVINPMRDDDALSKDIKAFIEDILNLENIYGDIFHIVIE